MKNILTAAVFAATALLAGCRADAPAPMGVVPDGRHLDWHRMEQYAFVHFTVNTFTDREWGYGDEPESVFAPTDFDADEMVKIVKDAGLKGLILTAKHHDGFCLWPSAYTEHSIKNSPYKGGKGDIVGELADACRRAGVKFGIYLSPWDRNHAGYGGEEYLEYYRNQLRELLTAYGPVFEMWFDGANGGDGYYGGANETRVLESGYLYYDWPEVVKIIRELSPETVVWSSSLPDARWCGNERGVIAETMWCTATPEKLYPDGHDDVEVLAHGMEEGDRWAPAEADVSIRPGWFWHADQQPKTPEKLFDIYLTSVGRGGTLLLNLAPDTRGRIPEQDVESLMAWRRMVDEAFADDLAPAASVEVSSSRGCGFGGRNVTGEGYWATPDGVTSGEATLTWRGPQRINYVTLQEHIELGQRVRGFAIDVQRDGAWRQVAEGTTVGYKRIVPLGGVETRALRVRFTDARGPLAVERISVH